MPDLEIIIGLEIHAQVSSNTKMFCNCDNDAFGKAPNTTVCPICMGHPGTLPVPNGVVIKKAMKASVAIGCNVNQDNHFDRKHYFYPDLPYGYQISQYDYPLASDGKVEYDMMDDSGNVVDTKVCGITRLHLENDAGKLTHRGNTTLCDYNRAGTPLMEIVTEPDLRNADEAVAFAQELHRILIAVDASDADMFKGMMRFDASLSLREKGTEKLNSRGEIKNLNSFKALERALHCEEARQRKIWEETGSPMQGDVTLGWNDDSGTIRVLREKESADDYRYFPEPDIPPLNITESFIAEVTGDLPTLPRAQRQQYLELGLSDSQALMLVDEQSIAQRFNAVYQHTTDAKRAASLVLTQLTGFLNAQEKTWEDAPPADNLIALLTAVDDGTISNNASKEVLEAMVQTGDEPLSIIEQKGLKQVTDEGAIDTWVTDAIAANPDAIASFKDGKEQALGAVVGWVMKQSGGQVSPKVVMEKLKAQL